MIDIIGVYYYRIVQERCYDRYERTFDIGVYPSICIDLMQLGLVRMKNTNNEAFGKICGEGKSFILISLKALKLKFIFI